MVNRTFLILGRILFDLLAVLAVFTPWIILHAINKPYKRGFYCNDESIRYPYKTNTVSSDVLTVVGFVLAFGFISMTELIHHFHGYRDIPSFRITETHYIPHFLVRIYKYFGVFLFGLAVQQTITNIGKYTIGRLRPHFMDVCQPDFSSLNCTMPGLKEVFIYVDQYQCKDESTRKYFDSRLSFPSGHSSFSTYVAIYLTLYLQSRFFWKITSPLRLTIQCLMLYGAFYTCLSRITDHKHHPTDVLTGAFLGFFVAAVAALHCTDLFKASLASVTSKTGRDYNKYNANDLENNRNSYNNDPSTYNVNPSSYNDNGGRVAGINMDVSPVRVHVN